jgi:hypothetical protein
MAEHRPKVCERSSRSYGRGKRKLFSNHWLFSAEQSSRNPLTDRSRSQGSEEFFESNLIVQKLVITVVGYFFSLKKE